ncbi:MAG: deoxyguanosinetriphosphate triphosphohydrolase [Devosia sp.]|jgi:dGTPase|nr:deoxyguanosinetriphosphate triphosphohydrolase [Devosia sp.]
MYTDADRSREVVVEKDGHDKQWRDEFGRDYGRIIHSASFRRQQGKTQVFPSRESDFFRNRLTHSLEVAQIAQGIAERINFDHEKDLGGKIDPRLCATAGLVHDIGHPPFGHNGESALDKAMQRYGGFEGNAQTLRILTRLEKKLRYAEPLAGDDRAGLNLCHRTIAATLKYDNEIPAIRKAADGFVKGYYGSEKVIVDRVKASVLNGYVPGPEEKFSTIECSIMDLADDIAYSVYDLEDCFKVGFLSPAEMLASDEALLGAVAKRASKAMKRTVTINEIQAVFMEIFSDIIEQPTEEADSPLDGIVIDDETAQQAKRDESLLKFAEAYRTSKVMSEDGYKRTEFSSELVHQFIAGVELKPHKECPALSQVYLPEKLMLRKEVLKQYTFVAAIYAPRVKLGEYRGYDLVTDIFKALMGDRGDLLMPSDVRGRIREAPNVSVKAREVCDFVAGMTDRYAMEFWARLNSDAAESMFKPI